MAQQPGTEEARDRDHDLRRERQNGERGTSRPRSSRSTTSSRSSRRRPAVARAAERATASRRRSTRSTGSSSPGGSDLDPSLYGAEAHPETNGTRPERDRGELALMEAALARDMPMLAICRGLEILNVLRGGDLVQHLPDVVGRRAAQGDAGRLRRPRGGRQRREPPGRAARRARARQVPSPPGAPHASARARGDRVGRRRNRRGARGSDPRVRGRRPLAPGGDAGRGALRRAGRRGARYRERTR